MSHPAIGIGHPVSDPPPRRRTRTRPPARARPAPRDLMVRYSRIPICHTDFGIRNPRIGNRGTGNSLLIQRFPLDEEDHGAVGCAP